ncbi:MAG: subclass B3 metallo-beta-lactamase [Sphingomicrobium sp.]
MPITIPFGKPRQIEQARGPITVWGPRWATTCEGKDMEWDAPAPPVRIHGNTYLVGTCGISALLITGEDGHILIDGGTERSADKVAANIARLGFDIRQVRFILTSHEHHDHLGAIARLRQLSGAQIVTSAAAARVIGTGRPNEDDPQFAIFQPFPTAPVGRIVGNGDQVRLRDLMVEAIATPGHTSGALSWRWISCEGGVCRMIVYADSLTPVSSDNYRFSDHPELVARFRDSIARIAASPCDILLTPHPIASDMKGRLAEGKMLLDPLGCTVFAAQKSEALDARLAKEAAAK